MSTLSAPRTPAQSRRALLGLAALFFAPLALAFVIYYAGGGAWRPAGSINHGTLITPARPTPELALPLLVPGSVAESTASAPERTRPDFLEHRWTLLYEGAGRCEAPCREALTATRQARLALARDTSRVQRVFLAQGACCDRDYLGRQQPDLIVVGESVAAMPLRALLPGAGSDRVYLLDPLGNLMMWYAPGASPRDMVSDLKRVLGVSHVG